MYIYPQPPGHFLWGGGVIIWRSFESWCWVSQPCMFASASSDKLFSNSGSIFILTNSCKKSPLSVFPHIRAVFMSSSTPRLHTPHPNNLGHHHFRGWKLQILITTLRLACKLLILVKKLKERGCIHPDWLIRGRNLKKCKEQICNQVKPGFR